MRDAMRLNGREFAFASCDVIDGDGKIVECIMVSDNAKKSIIGTNPVGACCLYSRKAYETIGEYDPEMTLVEDFDYWQRICAMYEPVCIPQKLYAYRWHDGALTSTMRKDTFNRTLEKCLLKNRAGFGKIDWLSNYYYYFGLHRCRENLGGSDPYRWKYLAYYAMYTLAVRVPNKLKRMCSGSA